ncbi:MAG: hypothetical protein ACXWEI_16275 [Mycobacterium sp.]
MNLFVRYLIMGLASATVPVALAGAPPALADCTSSGGTTICAQGEVRGGSDAPLSGPAYPGYCADPWYCSDDWGVDVYWDPGRNGSNPTPPGINNDLPGRGGRPGGGGGGGRR